MGMQPIRFAMGLQDMIVVMQCTITHLHGRENKKNTKLIYSVKGEYDCSILLYIVG